MFLFQSNSWEAVGFPKDPEAERAKGVLGNHTVSQLFDWNKICTESFNLLSIKEISEIFSSF